MMKTQSIDTGIGAERVQISLIRRKNFSQKLSQVLLLSQTAIQLSKRAIKRANKDLDTSEIDLLFINYHYGKDLAERVQKYLARSVSK